MTDTVQVHTLGRIALTFGEHSIDDASNRSKKVWALLIILILNHGRVVPQNELIDLLWNDDHEGANPTGALKTTLHRARAILAELSPEEGAKMLLHTKGGYTWNDEYPLWIDAEMFEMSCRATDDAAEDELTRLNEALALYRGGFLDRLSSEIWVIPKNTYYQNCYLQAVGRALELMQASGLYEQADQLCQTALRYEPYREELYQHRMRNLLALGRQAQAADVYENMSRLLLADFGVMPEAESRRLYREALRTVNRRTVPAGVIQEQLRESDPITGALICDYDFFKMIYQAEARMIARSGDAVHIALLELHAAGGAALPRKSLELAMDNLEQTLHANLRKGDIIARCSPSQFVVMLPQANYENSCMVCGRILRAFSRKYPHSPAAADFTVYPLEPSAS